MTRHPELRTRHRILISALALAAVAAVGTAAPSRAQLPSPLELHAELHDGLFDLLRVLDRIPERIERHHRRHLEVFFAGNHYDRHHRHQHATYHFPVWIDGVVTYRPYSYCGDRLILATGIHRPLIWQQWGRPTHGAWCASHRGYYPTSHSCFRPVRVVPRPVHRYDRWNRHDDHSWDHRRDQRWDHGRNQRWDRREHRHDRSCGHGNGHGRGHDRHRRDHRH